MESSRLSIPQKLDSPPETNEAAHAPNLMKVYRAAEA